jgi:hypothetical protein
LAVRRQLGAGERLGVCWAGARPTVQDAHGLLRLDSLQICRSLLPSPTLFCYLLNFLLLVE